MMSLSNIIDRYHSDSEVVLRIKMVNGVQQGSVLYKLGLIISTGGVCDNDVVAEDRYSIQSEGRTPGNEDSGGVDEDHSEVTDRLQQTCMNDITCTRNLYIRISQQINSYNQKH